MKRITHRLIRFHLFTFTAGKYIILITACLISFFPRGQLDIIKVENLSFEYTDKRALNSLDFVVPQNSIVALVGPNGSGKTTLLRCLAALERPVEGSIELNGIDVMSHPRDCHAQVGYLSDFFGLYNELTVLQCLEFVALSYGIKQADDAVDKAVTSLGLGPFSQKRAGELSRGWRQRLGIAQAIIHNPGILLLDEPASGLDPEARAELADLMLQLKEQGHTIVVSSHILAELSEYSSHMMVLDEGSLVEFRAVRDEYTGVDEIELLIVLSSAHEQLGAVLKRESCFTVQSCSTKEAVGVFRGDEAARGLFLKELIDAGLPVCLFETVEADMQQVYLDIIRNGRRIDG